DHVLGGDAAAVHRALHITHRVILVVVAELGRGGVGAVVPAGGGRGVLGPGLEVAAGDRVAAGVVDDAVAVGGLFRVVDALVHVLFGVGLLDQLAELIVDEERGDGLEVAAGDRGLVGAGHQVDRGRLDADDVPGDLRRQAVAVEVAQVHGHAGVHQQGLHLVGVGDAKDLGQAGVVG